MTAKLRMHGHSRALEDYVVIVQRQILHL